jgi:hypothetical protein
MQSNLCLAGEPRRRNGRFSHVRTFAVNDRGHAAVRRPPGLRTKSQASGLDRDSAGTAPLAVIALRYPHSKTRPCLLLHLDHAGCRRLAMPLPLRSSRPRHRGNRFDGAGMRLTMATATLCRSASVWRVQAREEPGSTLQGADGASGPTGADRRHDASLRMSLPATAAPRCRMRNSPAAGA